MRLETLTPAAILDDAPRVVKQMRKRSQGKVPEMVPDAGSASRPVSPVQSCPE